MSPLSWQTVNIPLAAGLNTKSDVRALEAPGLLACKNAAFTEAGGVQKRLPLPAVSGGALSNLRKLAVVNDELLAFTATEIYSWSPALAAWVSRGTHLAIKVTETSVFSSNDEQTLCDRAELSNVIVYTWLDNQNVAGALVYVAALDKTTGAVLLSPTSMGANTTRPRLVALTTRVLLFCQTAANTLAVKAIDVSSAANLSSTAGGSFTTIVTSFDTYYDVTKLSSTSAVAVWRRTTTTSYGYATVDQTPTVSANTKARTCDGVIGVAVTADGTRVGVARENVTDIQGDILDSAMADVSTAAAIGASASPDAIACAFRSVANGGAYRMYCFWANTPSTAASSQYLTRYNYVDTAGNVGTEADFRRRIAPASRAFDYNGSVYVWMLFGQSASQTPPTQVQNAFFLYRDDATGPYAKASQQTGGGYYSVLGWLPGVQSLGSGQYAWCATERRIIAVGSTGFDYADRSPRDVVFTFDSNEARRTVQLGRTLYISGGQITQYDGQRLVEVGFHVAPFYLTAANGAAGSVEAGDYSYLASLRWTNARGESERSTAASIITATISGSVKVTVTSAHVSPSLKTSAYPYGIEVWRTAKNPTSDSPHYLATSKDPTASGDNGYLTGDPTGSSFTFTDNFADATLITKEAWPEAGGVLESLAPPAATIIATGHDRVFLAGISYDPYLIWYSKTRADGEIASFHDALTVQLPPDGGPIRALAFLNETLIAFCDSAIYALPGDGFDNLGGGNNYGPPRLVAADVGAQSPEVVAATPEGLMFLSDKGWFLLNRGLSLQYIGAPVEDYNSDSFVAISVLEQQHQIRCLSTSRLLVFDYIVGQWSEWEEASRVDALVWSGSYYAASSSALYKEASSHGSDVTYSLIVETAWIKLAGLQGFKRVRHVEILGEYRSAHRLKVEIARDYLTAYYQTVTWTVSPTTVGGPERLRIGPSIQKVQAIKLRITDIATGTTDPPTGEGLKLTGLALEYGIKRGPARLPAAQKG